MEKSAFSTIICRTSEYHNTRIIITTLDRIHINSNSLEILPITEITSLWSAKTSRWEHHKLKSTEYLENTYLFFSWHEIGKFDIPAMIDYITNYTNQSQIFYVGGSQGATSFYVAMSMKPEYNKKIRLATLLCPVGFLGRVPYSLFRTLARIWEQIEVSFIMSLEYPKLLKSISVTISMIFNIIFINFSKESSNNFHFVTFVFRGSQILSKFTTAASLTLLEICWEVWQKNRHFFLWQEKFLSVLDLAIVIMFKHPR